MAPTAADCAHALLDVVPEVMQVIRRHVRHQRGHDLSVLQLRTLAFLAHCPGAPLSAVAEHVGLTLPSMSTQVSNLVERGLIARTTSPTDRRYVALQVTDQGAIQLAHVRDNARTTLAASLVHLSEAERAQVIEALTLLRAVLPAVPLGP
ncbi:MAG: winged helix-turn-helix transcriptional regulator [Caldilineaceae bacterium]|nr:winged helix-turn-helix transcriptional regulator [Caldilineaceae bacterium]